MNLKKGDSIKIMVGQFRNKTGKIEDVSVKKTLVYVSGIEIAKRDGTKARYPVNPSNLIITDVNMDDKMRNKSIKRK